MRLFALLLSFSYIQGIFSFSNPSRKSWWTKRVASDSIHTSGRLTERQIKYASEAGFKAIISLFTFSSQVGSSDSTGGSYLPSSMQAQSIAENQAAVQFQVILDSDVSDNTMTEETLRKITEVFRNKPKPLLFHCSDSYYSTFMLLLYYANITRSKTNLQDEPEISPVGVFKIGAQLGYDFGTDDQLRNLVEKLFDISLSETPQPDVLDKEWYKQYWMMKPVYKNWFISGQFQIDQLKNIRKMGFKSLTNSRRGATSPPNSTPSQEEVTLLNIKDRTGTYTGSGRQTTSQLVANMVNASKPTTYISQSAPVNYEETNTLEFGNDIGYNEETERQTIATELLGTVYVHIPIGGEFGYSTAMWDAYKEKVKESNERGLVLMQCRTGFRSSVLGILGAAYVNCFGSEWAIQRAEQIGYKYDSSAPAVLTLFRDNLDNREKNSCEDGNGYPNTTPMEKSNAGYSSRLCAVLIIYPVWSRSLLRLIF